MDFFSILYNIILTEKQWYSNKELNQQNIINIIVCRVLKIFNQMNLKNKLGIYLTLYSNTFSLRYTFLIIFDTYYPLPTETPVLHSCLLMIYCQLKHIKLKILKLFINFTHKNVN